MQGSTRLLQRADGVEVLLHRLPDDDRAAAGDALGEGLGADLPCLEERA